MASSKEDLKQFIEEELVAVGLVLSGEHSQLANLATALANAIVRERIKNAEVVVTGGSSAGSYKVS